jgi:anti-sigma factor RsiW
MTCREFDAIIEPGAAGEADLPDAAAEHLAGCPPCAARLALARRIEGTLGAGRPAEPPADFTGAVMSLVHRERWRSERRVDWVFNAALAAAAVLIATGIWMLFNLTGMAEVGTQASVVLAEGLRLTADRIAAQLTTYASATGLLLSAVVIWWWAERPRTAGRRS